MPVISLKNIKKIYPNGKEAVHDFSLDIDKEEFVVFVGPSGCGKSTVLRMIAGLEDITDGELTINGENMNEEEPIKRNIAMVFQNYALYPHLTVRQNIGFSQTIKSVPFKHFFDFKYRKARKKEINDQVEAIAKKIGLSEYLDTKPKNLSGGQRQRVALGRAIIRNPLAFLLDEPLSNLDAKMRSQMRTEIAKLHNDLKAIFIYVTHDQIEAMTMGSKIVVMKDGYIQQIATPSELFMNPSNKFVAGFIGTPQMNFFDVKIIQENGKKYVKLLENNAKLLIPEEIVGQIKDGYLSKEVTLGLRPKAISIEGEKSYVAQGIKGMTTISEQLGDEALVYFSLNGKNEYIASLLTYKKFEPNTEINLSFDLSHMCLFDKDSEESIIDR